jgi:hypothetical protein
MGINTLAISMPRMISQRHQPHATTYINHKEAPQRSVCCLSCNPKQEMASFLAQPPLPDPQDYLFHTHTHTHTHTHG